MKITSNFLLRKVLFLSAIFFLTFIFSCKKDGELSPDFDSGNLEVNYTDTFSLLTSVLEEDSIRTDLSSRNLLGLYNDPIFGLESASIYTQVILTGTSVDFGVGSTLDSIVLTLDYAGLYGDTASPMSINVYELSDDIESSTDYYSNSYLAYNPTAIGSLTFTPNLSDSLDLTFDTLMYKPHLRIKLNNTFGQSIMNADVNGSNDLADNSTFKAFMKGLYLTTVDSVSNSTLASGEGSVAYLDMNSSLSTLTMYYNDTSSYSFAINSEGEKYSRFDHNYTGTDVAEHLANSGTKNVDRTYISSMAGVKTKVEIPNIKDLSDEGDVIINKAEITFTVENGSEGNFDEFISSLSLVGINETGEAVFLPDFFEGVDYYGGVYDASTNSYKFNISRHIHDLVHSTTTDYGMYLVANSSSIASNRSVISSENSPNFRIKLEITYSKL